MKRLFGHFSRRRLLAAAVAMALVGISLILGGARRALIDRPDQQAAARWSGDGTRFAQLGVYLPESAALSDRMLAALRTGVSDALTQAAISSDIEGARLWLDAASAERLAAASTDQGNASVRLTAVAGDYFYLHPQRLLTGATFAESDELHDTIVLDELAAWQLFGSWDVTGRIVDIGGRSYVVCGVVAQPQDTAAVLTYGDRARVWVSYDAFFAGDEAALTCYEAVLPDPYSGFAADLLAKQSYLANGAVVEVSARYGFVSLLQTLRGLPRAGMRPDAAVYPWWENAAAYTAARAALLLGGQLLCLVWPVGLTLVWGVIAWRRRRWHLRDIAAAVDRRIQQRRQAAWDAAHAADGES